MIDYHSDEEEKRDSTRIEAIWHSIWKLLPNLDEREYVTVDCSNSREKKFCIKIFQPHDNNDDLQFFHAENFDYANIIKFSLVIRVAKAQYRSEVSEEQLNRLVKNTKEYLLEQAQDSIGYYKKIKEELIDNLSSVNTLSATATVFDNTNESISQKSLKNDKRTIRKR